MGSAGGFAGSLTCAAGSAAFMWRLAGGALAAGAGAGGGQAGGWHWSAGLGRVDPWRRSNRNGEQGKGRPAQLERARGDRRSAGWGDAAIGGHAGEEVSRVSGARGRGRGDATVSRTRRKRGMRGELP